MAKTLPLRVCMYLLGWLGFPGGSTIKNPPEMQKTQETWVRSLGREDPLKKGKGNGHPLQCSCLGNSMDSGAWWATVHGTVESDMTEAAEHARTRLISSCDSLLFQIVFLCSSQHQAHLKRLDSRAPPEVRLSTTLTITQTEICCCCCC